MRISMCVHIYVYIYMYNYIYFVVAPSETTKVLHVGQLQVSLQL